MSWRPVFAGLWASFPDLRFTVHDLIAQGARMAGVWTMEGTQQGEGLRVPATGRRLSVTGVHVFHIRDGRIARIAIQADYLGAMQQMGALPSAVQPALHGSVGPALAVLPGAAASIGGGIWPRVILHNHAMPADAYRPVPLAFERLPTDEQRARLEAFHDRMLRRRTVRHYSTEPVPDDIIDCAISVANSAPSGANMQPWRFVVVRDSDVKRRIREAAEQEERRFYDERATQEWLDALRPLGTDWHKEFLEAAPCLIVVFKVDYRVVGDSDGVERRLKHYYATESVGLACGFLLAALHLAGLATLTHTPSPMGFLSRILRRPANEKPFLLIPVGYPAADAEVPDITKQPLDDVRVNV